MSRLSSLTVSMEGDVGNWCRADAGGRLCVSSELWPPPPLVVRIVQPAMLPSAPCCSVASDDAALLARLSSSNTPLLHALCGVQLPPQPLRARSASAAAAHAGPAATAAGRRDVMSRGWMVSCTASTGAMASDALWPPSAVVPAYIALKAAAAADAAAAAACTVWHGDGVDEESMLGAGRLGVRPDCCSWLSNDDRVLEVPFLHTCRELRSKSDRVYTETPRRAP